ncbi:MocR-like pyridoxine biosynthesis transcription factor PdxR [Acuticoccus sediminis]|uniref:MocR-like pyridoxine biosynthesis transcription factor PdxR n=1 Tax=Acuticoccus sediminis TaxID=2184697 RepID=UPI001CFD011D|nr:PLP-dependent aminotransferase family protein [Acuticoccus sediminis]
MKRSSEPALPPIRLDPSIRNQSLRVRSGLRAAIVDGLLAPGLRLPSSRELAVQLGIGRNMVVAAYEQLMSDGLIEARHGSGTYVSASLPPPQSVATAPEIPLNFGRRRPFALGQTHVEPAFLSRLAAATRQHIAGASLADLAYGDPRGSPHLRRQIAEFLAVNRGIRCDPDCVVVVSGTQHGLRLCADALLSRGDPVWFEDPGYPMSHATLAAAGSRPVSVPVDADGLDVTAGIAREPRARAAYVTPSHQFPTGVRMGMDRRVALIDWAKSAGAWVFEDDYDSEFRYSGPPLTALAGLSPDRVIYLGTFAKTLFPGLRLGYVVVPPDALEPVLKARAAIDRFTPVFLQEAVADLMADGTIAAHLRRTLRRYRAHRDLVAGIVGTGSRGVLRPDIPEHGLHMIAWLREDLPTRLASAIRREAGVETTLFSETRREPGTSEGFVLGFSGYDAEILRSASTALAETAWRLASARHDVEQPPAAEA